MHDPKDFGLDHKCARLPAQLQVTDDTQIEGYASYFNRIDQGRDVVLPGAFSALGYDAVYIIVAAIKRAGGYLAVGAHGEQDGLGTHWELWSYGLGMKPIEALEAGLGAAGDDGTPLTAALAKAAEARRVRAELKHLLKSGSISFPELLERADGDPGVVRDARPPPRHRRAQGGRRRRRVGAKVQGARRG